MIHILFTYIYIYKLKQKFYYDIIRENIVGDGETALITGCSLMLTLNSFKSEIYYILCIIIIRIC